MKEKRFEVAGFPALAVFVGDGDEWVRTVTILGHLGRDAALAAAYAEGGFRSAGNGGPGRPFARHPRIRWAHGTTIVSQGGGLDV